MPKSIILYTLKVWLGAVLVTPLVFLATGFFNGPDSFDASVLVFYFALVLLEMIFSVLTWLFFYAFAGLVLHFVMDNVARKTILCTVGIALTAVTFRLFNEMLGLDSDGGTDIFMIVNIICIALGTWIFPLPSFSLNNQSIPHEQKTE